MVSQAATTLRGQLDAKMKELADAVEGLDDAKAAERYQEGEWCCKEVLSHLIGADEASHAHELRRFLDEDTPTLELEPGVAHFTAARQAMSVAALKAGVDKEYAEVGEFLAGLSDEQLARKARVPFLKDTPLTEYPTLAVWAATLISYHLSDHINHIRTARAAVGA
jgi:hypothetical protein